MKAIRKNGDSGIIIPVFIANATTGAGMTGLSKTTSGLQIGVRANNESTVTVYSSAAGTIDAQAALGTYSAPSPGTHCNFKEVDATAMPGWYELQLPDTRFSVSGAKAVGGTIFGASGASPCNFEYQLTGGFDLYDATRGGLTALPGANAAATGGLPTVGSGSGQISPDGSGNVRAVLSAGESGVIRAGTAQTGGASTITLDAGAASGNSAYVDCPVFITGGTGAGQANWSTTYNGTTKVLTVASAWSTVPDATSTFAIKYPSQRLLKDLLEADRYVDTSVTPWALVLVKKGSGALGQQGAVELLRQKLRDVGGAPITNTSTILGQSVT